MMTADILIAALAVINLLQIIKHISLRSQVTILKSNYERVSQRLTRSQDRIDVTENKLTEMTKPKKKKKR